MSSDSPQPQRWVKDPGPGQIRGEGDWVIFEGTDSNWQWLQETKFLPTRTQVEKPGEKEM